MKKLLIVIASASTLTAAAISSKTIAQGGMSNDSGLYLGANYGYLKVDSEDDFDDDSDAVQGLLGYRFNNFFAIEGSVIDFGSYGTDLAEASTDGYTFALKGTLPLTESFGLYAKIGQLWWETDYEVAGFDGKEEDESLFYGAGVSFDVTENFIVNAQYVVYDADLDANDLEDDIDDVEFDKDLEHIALGLEYRF